MPSIPITLRSGKTKKYSAAGVAAAGAAAIALSIVPGSADTGDASQSSAAKVSSAPVAFTGKSHKQNQQEGIAHQLYLAEKQVEAEKKSAQAAKTEKAQEAEKQAEQERQQKAASQREAKLAASRDAERAEVTQDSESGRKSYPDNLDGWIREARAIMDKHDIPGSYEGIHRNIMRESSGNPNAVNDWDVNAKNGTPSIGLLQVIKPTFAAYHVKGTPYDQYDPVANIVAACNYAADRYGSMDNVDSAY